MSIMQTIKMTWMIMWRLGIVAFIWMPELKFVSVFLIALASAIVLRYVIKVNIRTFPIIRFITRKPFYAHTATVKPDVTVIKNDPAKSSNNAPVTNASGKVSPENMISKPSAPGRMTGYEPRVLDTMDIPHTPYMRGVPGVGLDSASHMSNYNIKTGQKGEVNFAKALAKVVLPRVQHKNNTILENVNSFWSIAMPSEDEPSRPDRTYKTDIDCILVSGENIILVDTKFYASGDVTYTSQGNQLFCIDNATGKHIRQPRKMTRNMSMAMERFKKHYPDMHVSAIVVLMPTDAGSPTKVNAMWPGNIPGTTLTQAIQGIVPVVSDTGLSVKNKRVVTNLSMLRKG